MDAFPDSRPLAGWSVICLRPSSQQASVRRATRAWGAQHIALPGVRLAPMPDPMRARIGLQCALRCEAVVFTSPAAVGFAAKLLPLAALARASVFAVGTGTAKALADGGIPACMPEATAMHSEGVMSLPQWRGVTGPVGLVTAPGGRGVILAELQRRGLDVIRADVYRRLPPRWDARHVSRLRESREPRAVLVSSGEALDRVLDALAGEDLARLLDATAVVSSQRLASQASRVGFARVLPSGAPTATAMLHALACHASSLAFR